MVWSGPNERHWFSEEKKNKNRISLKKENYWLGRLFLFQCYDAIIGILL